MSADGLKIRARVQARATTNAVERFVQHWIFAHLQAAVIDQHQMELALHRTIRQRRCGLHRRRQNAGVRRKPLTRRARSDQFDERSEILALGEYLFDAGNCDVQRRELRGEANVAFTLYQHDAASIGGDEVRAGNAGIGI